MSQAFVQFGMAFSTLIPISDNVSKKIESMIEGVAPYRKIHYEHLTLECIKLRSVVILRLKGGENKAIRMIRKYTLHDIIKKLDSICYNIIN